MPNPGSYERMPESNAPQSTNKMLIGMMITLLIMFAVMSFRQELGQILDVVFKYVAFVDNPILTLILAGVIMVTLSTVVRNIMQDPVETAKNQQLNSDFQKEFRQARIDNNLFKMKKLEEIQPQMMDMQMKQSTDQMKTMPVTMIFIIPMYAWIWFFLAEGGTYFPDVTPIAMMPWGVMELNTVIMGWFPAWIIIYTMIFLPVGQIENYAIRYYLLKKKLKQLDLAAQRAEVE